MVLCRVLFFDLGLCPCYIDPMGTHWEPIGNPMEQKKLDLSKWQGNVICIWGRQSSHQSVWSEIFVSESFRACTKWNVAMILVSAAEAISDWHCFSQKLSCFSWGFNRACFFRKAMSFNEKLHFISFCAFVPRYDIQLWSLVNNHRPNVAQNIKFQQNSIICDSFQIWHLSMPWACDELQIGEIPLKKGSKSKSYVNVKVNCCPEKSTNVDQVVTGFQTHYQVSF